MFRATRSSEPDVRIQLPRDLDTPVPVIDIDILESNIASMASQLAAREVKLRPHFKTPKMIEVARRQLAAGGAGLTCATIGEAEVLAQAGVQDIFIAYPLWPSTPKVARMAELLEIARISIGVDAAEPAERWARSLNSGHKRLSVLIEVDSGDRRSGASPEDAGAIAKHAAEHGLDVAGVFTHGGHGYRPGRRESAARDEVDALARAVASLRKFDLEPRVVSAGSTPTVLGWARDGVTEERPGTYVFGDRQQAVLGSCTAAEIALVVAATVVSSSVSGQFVIDAGAKSLAKDRPEWLNGYSHIPASPSAVIARLYDHHAVCELPPGVRPPALGEVVAVVPNHVCPVVNLARQVPVSRHGEAVDSWDVVARAL